MTTTSATFNGVRFAGGDTIVNLTATILYPGTFSGTSVLHGTLTFQPNGTANFHDIETFTGTVNGVPGTGPSISMVHRTQSSTCGEPPSWSGPPASLPACTAFSGSRPS